MSMTRDKTPFDEAWYLRKYPDAAAAVARGEFADAWTHYEALGRQEDRETCPFDEAWYLFSYPDVVVAVEEGKLPDARYHYMQFGYLERRQPLPSGHAKRVFAYGSFGTNNVGDEAILEGVKRLHPDCIQLYHHKRRVGEGVQPHQVLNQPDFFRPDDYLILGGGGLLYSRETVVLMTNLAKAARAAGATVDIGRLGCEAAHEDYAAEMVELFSLVRRASVRSTISQAIMKEFTGKTFPVEFDFAFNLTSEVRAMPRRLFDTPTIGVVTATSGDGDVRGLAAVLRTHTRPGRPVPIRFIHIPHSHSYFDARNNDRVTAEQLWSYAGMHEAASEDLFQLRDYDPEPLSVLRLYRQLDGVITSRYHGLIFANMAETPTLALGGGLVKLRSFIEDHPSPDMLIARTTGQLAEQMVPFIEAILARRAGA